MKRFKQIFNHQPPARLIALGFASTILLGTLLLLMPFSIRSGITVQPVDALFSATSAVCVTGLLTVDTADTFTPVGQAVMAVLIQIGGLGITSIGMGLALAAGRRISLRERTLIREAMNVSSLEGMVRLVRAIIKLTLAFELAGVIPIFAVFAQDYPPLKALGLSVFHSISSFNNAGIDILGGGRSLAPYRDNVLLNLSTCFLIISGGIGFLVMVDVVKCRFRFRKFTLHSKVVVTTTAFLLAAGTLLLKFTDPLSWLTAFFLSVSARTAGFATLDLGTLSNAGLFTILILMFIGASPGSTGGGIKTTTIFVLAQRFAAFSASSGRVHSAVHCLPTPLPRLLPLDCWACWWYAAPHFCSASWNPASRSSACCLKRSPPTALPGFPPALQRSFAWPPSWC